MKFVAQDKYEELVALARRRGFFWQSYEIYGGVSGFIDLGPLGAELKRNIEDKWRKWFIHRHQDFIFEIETPIIGPSIVFEASGHVESFTDPVVECRECHKIYRADHLIEEYLKVRVEGYTSESLTRIVKDKNLKCPSCGGELGEVRTFNLLFKTSIGPYRENLGYIRPETAQGMFTAFKRVYEALRGKMPIGIAQIGRVGRNEISPRQGMVRLREFTIMEVELFFDPEDPDCPLLRGVEEEELTILTGESKKRGGRPVKVKVREAVDEKIIINEWLAYFMSLSKKFVEELGVPASNQMFEEKLPEERAHYSSQTFDQLVKVDRWGWIEVSGHSYRGDYDLSRHMRFSGRDLTVYKRFKEAVKNYKISLKVEALKEYLKEDAEKVLREFSNSDRNALVREFLEKKTITLAGHSLDEKFVSIVEEDVLGKKYIPHVIEPSFGAERLTYVTLEYALKKREGRTVLSLPVDVAPVKVAVFPLVSREPLTTIALKVKSVLQERGLKVIYDDSGSIGRRYARADEIGVPICITVDYNTPNDSTVTLRSRDTWLQVRTKISKAVEELPKYFRGEVSFESLGVPVK